MMEQLLADTVMEVTADEYRALMTARAERVQK
jgi:hypothetical protein